MHFVLLCPPGTGHLNNFAALGYELRQRGHRVSMFGLPDVEPYAKAAESVKRSQSRLGKLNGIPHCFTLSICFVREQISPKFLII